MVDKSVTGIVTWLKSWFYDKDDVDGKLNTHTITSSSSFGNLGTSVGATQHQINSAINSLITGSGSGGNVSLACVSDFDLDSSDPTDVEIFLDACSGKVIDSVNKSTSGLVDTYTITYSDNTTYQFTVTNGSNGTNGTNGTNGRGISSISKTSSSGKVDTYTITYTDSTTSTFTVTNGSDASVTVVDNLTSDSSTSVLSAKQGKVLNTNKIETSAIANNLTTTNSGYVLDARQGKALADLIGSAITYINQ